MDDNGTSTSTSPTQSSNISSTQIAASFASVPAINPDNVSDPEFSVVEVPFGDNTNKIQVGVFSNLQEGCMLQIRSAT